MSVSDSIFASRTPSMKHSKYFTVLLIIFVIYSLSQVMFSGLSWGIGIGIFLVVYVYTDLISGVLHIVLDNEKSLKVPPLKILAEEFQEHHRNPNLIHEMDLYMHLYTIHLPLVIAFPFVPLFDLDILYFVYLNFVFSLHLMQMAHRWAHLPSNRINGVVLYLQNRGVLVSRRIHLGHHNNIYDENFCIMNGWFNTPLNWIVGIFGRTSHAWIAVFLILVSLAYIVPYFIFSS